MTETANYKLKKPAPEDFYNIADCNENMDKVDTALATKADKTELYNPNLLINGDFKVWQRGTSFANPNNQYTADRFNCTGTGAISKVANGAQIVGAIAVKYTMETGDFEKINGKTCTLSYSKNDIITTSTFLVNNSIVLNLSFNDCVINWIKLEIGSIATQFSPRSYATELLDCERYYRITPFSISFGHVGDGNFCSLAVSYLNLSTIPTVWVLDGQGNKGKIDKYRGGVAVFNQPCDIFVSESTTRVVANLQDTFEGFRGTLYEDAEIY